MAFLLRRNRATGGGWVAPAGSVKSYTHRRDKARRFPTREAAEADRCVENEEVEDA